MAAITFLILLPGIERKSRLTCYSVSAVFSMCTHKNKYYMKSIILPGKSGLLSNISKTCYKKVVLILNESITIPNSRNSAGYSETKNKYIQSGKCDKYIPED